MNYCRSWKEVGPETRWFNGPVGLILSGGPPIPPGTKLRDAQPPVNKPDEKTPPTREKTDKAKKQSRRSRKKD